MIRPLLRYALPAGLAWLAIPVVAAFNGPDNLIFPDANGYAVAHSILQALSFAICTLIFGAGWYAGSDNRSGVMALLSTAFLAVGMLDLGHLLALGGHPDFDAPAGGRSAHAFGFAAHLAGSMALLVIALRPARLRVRMNLRYVLFAAALVYVGLAYWVLLTDPDLLPETYRSGEGPTAFKTAAEGACGILYFLSAVVLALRGLRNSALTVAPLIAPAILLAGACVAFAFDHAGHDNLNLLGHVFKLGAFVLIYRVVVHEVIREPNKRRLQTEASLRRSQAHLKRAQRIGKIGSIDMNMATGKGEWSEEFYAIMGVDPATAQGSFELHLAMTHPDDRAKLIALRNTSHAGDATEASEVRVIRPDGQVRRLLRRAERVPDGEGRKDTLIVTFQDITDRKQADEELQKSQNLLGEATRAAQIGIYTHEHATGAVYWSPEQRRNYGVGMNETITFETFLSMIHPLDRRKIDAAIERANDPAGDGRFDVEQRIVRRDGTVRWLLTRGHTDFEGEGSERHPVRAVGAVIDITDAKEVEMRLRRGETHLALAQTVGMIGSAEFNLSDNKFYRSEAYTRLLGLDSQTSPPSDDQFMAVILPEDRGKIIPVAELLKLDGPIPPLTFRIRRPDGETRWLHRHAKVITDSEGKPVSVIFSSQDITDFVLAEEKLRRSEAHLALAQSVSRIGSAEFDLVGRRHHRSEEYARLLGLDPAKITVGASLIREAVIPEDIHKIRPIAELEAAKGPIPPIDFRVRDADGSIRWLRRDAAKINGADGEAAAIIFTLLDITDMKRAEERHLQLERQLAQAQKMEAVGQLTGGVAHDFNNLLAVILGRLHLLEEELAGSPSLREWALICIRAAERGASLTRSLLAFSRMQTLKPARIELGAIIADMIELLRRVLGEAIAIRLTMPPDLWPCLADPGQVQTALLNLAVNARDAMPDGGELVIEARNAQLDEDYAARQTDVRAGDYVMLTVSDTGLGMSAETLDRAFEPFFTTKGVGKGSGLGLSMVYGFARQSGGHVTLYSELDHGTTVKLYLPRAAGMGASEGAAAAVAKIEQGHETILVIEDNDELRDLTQVQLERLGYRAYGAPDSVEGLRLLREHPETALLLCDVVLGGGVSGPQFAESAMRLRPDLGVVFMTGYSGPAALGSGGATVLLKPFTLDDLARQVRAALERRTAQVK